MFPLAASGSRSAYTLSCVFVELRPPLLFYAVVRYGFDGTWEIRA